MDNPECHSIRPEESSRVRCRRAAPDTAQDGNLLSTAMLCRRALFHALLGMRLSPKDRGAKARGRHNVDRAVMVEINSHYSVPDAAAVIDEMRNQPGPAVAVESRTVSYQ